MALSRSAARFFGSQTTRFFQSPRLLQDFRNFSALSSPIGARVAGSVLPSASHFSSLLPHSTIFSWGLANITVQPPKRLHSTQATSERFHLLKNGMGHLAEHEFHAGLHYFKQLREIAGLPSESEKHATLQAALFLIATSFEEDAKLMWMHHFNRELDDVTMEKIADVFGGFTDHLKPFLLRIKPAQVNALDAAYRNDAGLWWKISYLHTLLKKSGIEQNTAATMILENIPHISFLGSIAQKMEIRKIMSKENVLNLFSCATSAEKINAALSEVMHLPSIQKHFDAIIHQVLAGHDALILAKLKAYFADHHFRLTDSRRCKLYEIAENYEALLSYWDLNRLILPRPYRWNAYSLDEGTHQALLDDILETCHKNKHVLQNILTIVKAVGDESTSSAFDLRYGEKIFYKAQKMRLAAFHELGSLPIEKIVELANEIKTKNLKGLTLEEFDKLIAPKQEVVVDAQFYEIELAPEAEYHQSRRLGS